MKDSEKFINVADLKRKLRYIFKQYDITKYMQEVYLGIIEKIPYFVKGQLEQTLDIEETESGKWEINPDGYYPYCSRCKEEPKSGIMTKYCPDCGARMDLKE